MSFRIHPPPPRPFPLRRSSCRSSPPDTVVLVWPLFARSRSTARSYRPPTDTGGALPYPPHGATAPPPWSREGWVLNRLVPTAFLPPRRCSTECPAGTGTSARLVACVTPSRRRPPARHGNALRWALSAAGPWPGCIGPRAPILSPWDVCVCQSVWRVFQFVGRYLANC
jgi:hypothetical protein